MRRTFPLLATGLFLAAAQAHAHTGEGTLGGFQSGFTHPILGFDHLLAMLLVGIWGAQMGGKSLWTLPVVFPLVMAVGGFAGAAGVPLPGTEALIALSSVGLGLCVAFAWKPKQEWIPMVIVGAFAIFHGHAHGTELPPGQSGLLYSMGFVIATGILHGLGIALGLIQRWPGGQLVLRGAGAVIAVAGMTFLWRALW
jgi:urease accessory protein